MRKRPNRDRVRGPSSMVDLLCLFGGAGRVRFLRLRITDRSERAVTRRVAVDVGDPHESFAQAGMAGRRGIGCGDCIAISAQHHRPMHGVEFDPDGAHAAFGNRACVKSRQQRPGRRE